MRKTILLMAVAVMGALAVAGCSHRAKPTTASQTSSAVPELPQTSTSGADSSRAGAGSATQGGAGAGNGASAAQLSNRVIYFDFDNSDIKAEYTDLVAAHARNLAANASIKVRLEGHTDERGSREYNIGLGERRAQAVKRALMLQGVTEAQISTVSYGEERPAVTGHTEEAWSRNRRVEIVYVN
jgi:peptidoglycan-associated lipoprotein